MDEVAKVPLSTTTDEPYWNASRKEIHAWLMAKAPELGYLFQGSLRMLYIKDFPGKLRLICHAVREIRNRLPDFIGGPRTASKIEYIQHMDKLLVSWIDSGLSLDIASSGVVPEVLHENSITVELPYPLYKQISLLLKEHEGRETNKDAAIRLFEGITPESKGTGEVLRPIIIQWIDITEWFVDRAHVGKHASEEELFNQFVLFETMLGNLIRGFFKTSRSLDEILEDTNT